MLNIIQNTIGAIRRVGESVVRAGLKMWLPFTKAEHLGRESVEDNSFNDTNKWIKENGWVVSGGLATRTDVDSYTALQQNCLVSGKTYTVTIVVDSVTSGNIFGVRLGTNYILQGGLSVGTHTATGTANGSVLSIMGNPDFAGIISSISIKELTQETPDISGNDNNAILKTGKALVFHANDSIETSFPTSKDIKTIAFWIYPTGSNTNETLFWFGGSQFSSKYVLINNLTLTSSPYARTDFDVYVDGVFAGATFGGQSVTLVQDQWQRVVFKSSTAINVTSDTFNVAGGVSAGGQFKMSDLQIYGAEFTTDDIAYDYANPQKLVTDNASSNVTLNDLDLYLAMTEGDGSIAYDSSGGTRYDGVIDGATYQSSQERILQLGMISWAKSTPVSDEVILPYNPNDVTQDILGNAVRVKGSGFNLDGTGYGEVLDDSALDIPACNNVDEGGFTLSAWVKSKYVSKSSSINVVSTLGGDVTQPGTGGIVVFDTNKFGAYINAALLQADNTFIEGNWYYVVITRSVSGNCKLYVDTNAQIDTDYTLGSITNSNNKMVGRDSLSYQRFYEERIDDVKFYNRELSLTEIEQNFNATKSGHNN